MQIKINNKEYEAQEGETILDVCRRENIPIPTLCAHGKLKKEAVCRLCLVEINLTDKLVTSCSFPVCEKLEVTTESEKIKKAREINMELLWSDHAGKCVKCKRNRHCELQTLAEEYKIDNFHFVPRKEDLTSEEELDLLKDNRIRVVIDDKNPVIYRTTEFCVECRRCINICPTKQYGFNNRAGDVVVGTPYEKTLDCIFCGACVKHCPTAALTDKNDLDEIISKLDDISLLAVAILDPAVMESISNEFPEITSEDMIVGLLKNLGFEKVFSLGWGMEQYVKKISEELSENKLLISSHCPSFKLYIEKYHSEFVRNISKLENPNEIMAKYIKNEYAKREKINPENIVAISISACVSKKAHLSQNHDYVLTVRELGRLARKKAVKINEIKESKFDTGFQFDSKYLDMVKFGGLENILDKKKIKSIVVNDTKKADEIFQSIRKKEDKFDFIEGMICPGGCISGGGQSIRIKS